MRNLNKAIHIAERENVDYQDRITGMREAYRATPHPSTSKSPYELMFGRKISKRRMGDMILSINRNITIGSKM